MAILMQVGYRKFIVPTNWIWDIDRIIPVEEDGRNFIIPKEKPSSGDDVTFLVVPDCRMSMPRSYIEKGETAETEVKEDA
ncbi:MAG: hypothetical protein WC455_21410 [Dehalococcoidia bacterium]|jgi:hypothetical protein